MVCREDLIPLAGHLSQMGGQAGITAVPRDSSGPGLPRKRSQCSFSHVTAPPPMCWTKAATFMSCSARGHFFSFFVNTLRTVRVI